ncbi:RNA polymerase subunit sigma-24 [Clostridiales bacterium PH28_bin88]|nr:RNA polymerase subunit sigma-24 [Clostridiales bacterium PH28_bin88]
MGLPEEELVSRSKAGDTVAFENLIAQYERQVYTVAYRFMGNHEDASDLAQEALVRAFQSLKNFRGESSFKTWLYHIVANVCRDEMRRRRRQPVISLDEPVSTEDGEVWRQTPDWTHAPDRVFEEKERKEYLQNLINALVPEYRLVIVMREIQGFSYEEIAREMDCSLGTVKSRLNRARQALRDKIRTDGELFPAKSRLMS